VNKDKDKDKDKDRDRDRDYRLNTLEAYQNFNKAKKYYAQHHKSMSWAWFMMWLELRCVSQALIHFEANEKKILDIPCGTGIAANTINDFDCEIIAIDISLEMQEFAKDSYKSNKSTEFIIGDITNIPLPDNYSYGSIVLGFFHRVPYDIKKKALLELHRVNKEFIVFSFSMDSFFQRLKKRFYSIFNTSFKSAPKPLHIGEIKKLLSDTNFKVEKIKTIIPFLSSEIIIWATKN